MYIYSVGMACIGEKAQVRSAGMHWWGGYSARARETSDRKWSSIEILAYTCVLYRVTAYCMYLPALLTTLQQLTVYWTSLYQLWHKFTFSLLVSLHAWTHHPAITILSVVRHNRHSPSITSPIFAVNSLLCCSGNNHCPCNVALLAGATSV